MIVFTFDLYDMSSLYVSVNMSLPLRTHAHAHITEDFNLDPDEYDPMDDMEISAADKSGKFMRSLIMDFS